MGMREKMKEKRIPLTSAQKSQKVIKSISRGDSEELKYSMRLIIEQNRREYIEGSEAIGKDNSIYNTSDTSQKKKKKTYHIRNNKN